MKIKIIFFLIILIIFSFFGIFYYISNKNKFVEFTGIVTQSNYNCLGTCLLKVEDRELEISATPFIAVGQKVSIKALLANKNLLTTTCSSCYVKLLSPIITPIR